MSMNSPMAPESIRALMDMGVLLSTVLSCSGMSFPCRVLQSVWGKGVVQAWLVQFSVQL